MNTLKDILAFHQLVINKTEEEKIELAQILDIDFNSYKKRIIGKEKEAELIVIMKSLGILKHFDAFDESFTHITDEFTSDFRIEMTDGYKMLIEVKHTDQDEFKISNGNLANRINYANNLGLPLRFAISLKGYWGLFTSDELQQKNGKITIDDFGGDTSVSWFDQEFETCSYMFPKKITIESIYAHNHHEGMGIEFDPYGELISYRLIYGDRLIFEAKGKNNDYTIFTILLEALHDRVANCNQKIESNNDYTTITETTDDMTVHTIREYEFLLSYIQHMVDENGLKFTPERAIDNKSFSFIDKKYIRATLSHLVDLGVDIVVFKGSAGYLFKDYQKQFWSKM